MYAIIESGSHQFRVGEGDRITIDKRPEAPGSEITFDRVLLIAGTEGGPAIGAPTVAGASVVAKVLDTYRAKKIVIRKFRRRKGYRRKRGHRQTFTTVQIVRIAAGA